MVSIRFLYLIILVIALSCNAGVEDSSQPASDSPPNIVLIFADDLGYGDLSSYGHPVIKTPHLDGLASEGVKCMSFYAIAAVCTPSRAGLLTGRYPIRNLPHNIGPESDHGLPVSEITIGNILQDAGYATKAIGKWHLGHAQPELMPTSRGFDSYYGLLYSNDMILPWCPWLSEEDRLYLFRDTTPLHEVQFAQDSLTLWYTHEATQFIREQAKDQPFFLYLAHSMPHLPISTAESFRGQSEAGLYGDVIQTMDWSTGEILKTLNKMGVAENTIVIFTSDNGPWQNLPIRMLQKGNESWHSGSAGLLRGAKGTTWEGGMRVPAIIRWPNEIPANSVSRGLMTTIDLFTTLVQIAKAEIPDDRPIDGMDILPTLKGTKDSPRQDLFYFSGKQLQAARNNIWKLRFNIDQQAELFHLGRDPSEKYNVLDQHREVARNLLEKMKDFAGETGAELPGFDSIME